MGVLFLFAALAFAATMTALAPIALVWAVNILAPFQIAYTLETWLAAFIILFLFHRTASVRSKEKKEAEKQHEHSREEVARRT